MPPPHALDVLGEIKSPSLALLHPLKLDKWHRALVGLPERIYMQYSCETLFEHVKTAADALRAMVDVLGPKGLPVHPQELGRRTVKSFRWYVPWEEEEESGLVEFQASWDKEASSWKLNCLEEASTTMSVDNLKVALEKSLEWVVELEREPEIDETPDDEG